jgi:hypothetical protein
MGMIDPVSRSVWGERKVTYGISVDFVIELEEDTETGVCQDGVRRFGENVIVRKTFCCCRKSLRCQELLDRKVGELNDLKAADIHDGDKTRTCRQNCFLCVCWPPIWVKCGGCCCVELNCQDLREFFDAKRPNGHRKASEKALSESSFLLIDAQ